MRSTAVDCTHDPGQCVMAMFRQLTQAVTLKSAPEERMTTVTLRHSNKYAQHCTHAEPTSDSPYPRDHNCNFALFNTSVCRNYDQRGLSRTIFLWSLVSDYRRCFAHRVP